MAAGSIVVDLLLNSGAFETDTQRAAASVTKLGTAIDRQVQAIQRQNVLFEANARETKLYELATKGATQWQLAAADAALKQAEALKRASDAAAATAAIDKQVAALQTSVSLYGKSADEIKVYELALAGASQQQLAAAQAALALGEAQRQASKAEDFIAGLQRQADAAGKTRAELLAMQAAELGVADKAAPLIQKLTQASGSVHTLGAQHKLTAYETQQLSFQLNDLFVQIASGQSPLTALIQQGSQLGGTFGGVGGTVRALASVFTPLRLLLGGVAGAAGALGVAWYQGNQQAKDFQQSLQLTGNFAGITAGQFQSSAKSIAEFTNTTVGSSKEVLQALVSTGQFGPGAIESAASAVLAFSRASGKSTDDVVKDFATITNGVSSFAAEHSKSYHILTADQLAQVRSLEAQGKVEQAIKLVFDATTQTLQARQRPLGEIEKLLESGKNKWSAYWDAATATGRPTTVEDRVAASQRALDAAQKAASNSTPQSSAQVGSVPLAVGRRGVLPRQIDASDAAARAQSAKDSLEAQAAAEADAAKNAAAQLAADREKERKASSGYQAQLTSLTQAGINARLAAAQLSSEQEEAALEQSYEAQIISARGYQTALYSIQKGSIDAQAKALNEEIALAKSKPSDPSDPDDLSKQTKLVELEGQRTAIASARLKLNEQARKGELRPADASAQLASRIASINNSLTAQTDAISNSDKLLEASHAAALIEDRAYYDKKTQLIVDSTAAQTKAIADQLAVLQTEQLVGKANVENDKAQAEARARLVKVQKDAAASLDVLGIQRRTALKAESLALIDAATAEQQYLDAQDKSNRRAVAAVGQSDQERDRSAGLAQIDDKYSSQRDQLASQRLHDQLTAEQYTKQLAILDNYQQKAVASWTNGYDGILAAQGDWTKGAHRAFANYVDVAANVAKQTEDLFTHAFSGIEDAFTSFVTTGKADLKGLSQALAADIVRFEARQLISAGAKQFGISNPAVGAAAQSGTPSQAAALSASTNAVNSMTTAATAAAAALNRVAAAGGLPTGTGPVDLSSGNIFSGIGFGSDSGAGLGNISIGSANAGAGTSGFGFGTSAAGSTDLLTQAATAFSASTDAVTAQTASLVASTAATDIQAAASTGVAGAAASAASSLGGGFLSAVSSAITALISLAATSTTSSTSSAVSAVSAVAAYAKGTDYVPKTGLALLHEGEAVIPKGYNPAAGGNAAALQGRDSGSTDKPIVIQQHFHVDGNPPSRQTQMQLAAAAAQGVSRGRRNL